MTPIIDIVKDMPRHPTKKYAKKRENTEVLFVHHSGAFGKPGRIGAFNSAKYDIEHRDNGGWPGFAYHFWIPYALDMDGQVIYKGNELTTRCFHTGGKANKYTAVCLQGNLGEKPPTEGQLIALRDLVSVIQPKYVVPHSGSKPWGGNPKASCPGSFLEQFIANNWPNEGP